MGSWSVYCGISQIAITAGQDCVLLVLKKVRSSMCYFEYLPATLPIFGTYDDYGGIEDIIEDANTKLIEEHFGFPIQDFCEYFTRGCVRDDEEGFPKDMKNIEEIKNWTFMFIDRKVYDFMSSHVTKGYGGAGSHDIGNSEILKVLGFERNPELDGTYTGFDPKRYHQAWTREGVNFFGDGTWINHENGSGVYNISTLLEWVTIPEEAKFLLEQPEWKAWRIFDEEKQKKLLSWTMGKSTDFIFSAALLKKLQELSKDGNQDFSAWMEPKAKLIVDKYFKDLNTFGDSIADLRNIIYNLHPMSAQFEPHKLYLTPQCGEFREHQFLLDKFAEINKTYITDDEDDD